MSSSRLSLFQSLAAALAVAAFAAGPAAAEIPPSYRLRFLGAGSPSGINDAGLVVGARIVGGSTYVPLVSVDGAPWSELPVPAGATSVFPTDVNDAGVIIGVAFDASFVGTAVRWTRSGGVWSVESLPRIAGDTSAYASAINERGQIVGARGTLGYVPAARPGWLYDDDGGLVDLAAAYGWFVAPVDIDDAGVLVGGVERLDLATGVLETVPAGPSNYQAVGARAINERGMMAGTAPLRSTSLNIVSLFRFEPATGWSFVAGTTRFTTLSSMNDRGDIGYGELGTGLSLYGLGTYPLFTLLDPVETAAGWSITGSGAKVNDQRMVAALASNSATGESGGVLLVPPFVCGDSIVAGFEACDDGNTASGDGCSAACRVEECGNGLDDDGDGFADFPADPGCRSAVSLDESPACQNGLDDDGAPGIDFDGGAAANGGVALAEPDPECAGAPWRSSEGPGCGLGVELIAAVPLLAGALRRLRR